MFITERWNLVRFAWLLTILDCLTKTWLTLHYCQFTFTLVSLPPRQAAGRSFQRFLVFWGPTCLVRAARSVRCSTELFCSNHFLGRAIRSWDVSLSMLRGWLLASCLVSSGPGRCKDYTHWLPWQEGGASEGHFQDLHVVRLALHVIAEDGNDIGTHANRRAISRYACFYPEV